ncbi:MAG TPA: hypothetical protein VHJ77_09980 [Vicinamibacterales bacterium]|jgi:hypothetical protein|nr:hypothetical protein [Vicinamibacterales bacterium]
MSTTSAAVGTPRVAVERLPRAESRGSRDTVAAPWYVWTAVLAVFSGVLGAHWDISWHRSIGRDTFWSPPHIAIYMMGVLAGITFGYLILRTTFGRVGSKLEDVVTIYGLRGPLGAFIAAWGGVAMITSAPFDNWWHDAYGLDVKIVSPPHVLLIIGGMGVMIGTLVLIQARLNRAAESSGERGHLLLAFFLVAGLALVDMLVFQMEWTFLPYQHSATMYRALAVSIPAMLCAFSVASGHRWACTIIASIYTIFLLALVWILPLFPAQPKLGPVYTQVTHFVPNGFPLLFIVPAVVLDVMLRKLADRPRWLTALAAGVGFLAVFFAAQWLFAIFLNSPAARNWVFGSHYRAYMIPSTGYSATYRFFPVETSAAEFWRILAMGFVFAPLSARFGLALGDWLKRIRR